MRPPGATLEVPAPSDPNAPTLRVLFIGNSLTYAGDLPAMIQDLARTAGVNLVYDQHTPGGARLLNHAADPQVRALLARGGWDAVVLQEQSEWPAFSDEQVRSGIEPYATALATEARAASPSVRLLLYETPARRDGDPQNASVSPELATYERRLPHRVRLPRHAPGAVPPSAPAIQRGSNRQWPPRCGRSRGVPRARRGVGREGR